MIMISCAQYCDPGMEGCNRDLKKDIQIRLTGRVMKGLLEEQDKDEGWSSQTNNSTGGGTKMWNSPRSDHI